MEQEERKTKTCPYCAEEISAAAIKCKHCMSDLEINRISSDPLTMSEYKNASPPKMKNKGIAVLLNLVIPGYGFAYCGHWVTGAVVLAVYLYASVMTMFVAAIPLMLLIMVGSYWIAGNYNKQLPRES